MTTATTVEDVPLKGSSRPDTLPLHPDTQPPHPDTQSSPRPDKEGQREGLDIFEDMFRDFCEFLSKEIREMERPARSCLRASIDLVDHALDRGKGLLEKLRRRVTKDGEM